MKRNLLLAAVGVVAAGAIVYGLRHSQGGSSAAVTALLPKDTTVFVHVPDLNRTRQEWRGSDIYKLYTEPAVQDFLKRPLERVPKENSFAQTMHDFEKLEAKDLFVALTNLSGGEHDIKIVAGFQFHGSQDQAEIVIGRWRKTLLGSGTPEIIEHQQHKIETVRTANSTAASAYAGQWFFAANDVDEIKAMLDRADGRIQDKNSVLAADENFRAASGKISHTYSAMAYFQPRAVVEKVHAFRQSNSPQVVQQKLGLAAQAMEKIRYACASTGFDNGKMRDVLFVAMPKQAEDGELSRSSISLASPDTFLYAATLLNLSRQFAAIDPASGGTPFVGGIFQKIARGLAAAGMTADDWKTVFGSEASVISDWPQQSHWPTLFVACPVKDPARARQTATALARNLDDDGAWTETDRDAVHYISMPYATGFITIQPTIAIADNFMVAGLDAGAVETAIKRSKGSDPKLAGSTTYKQATGSVPAPGNYFSYVDLPLLYGRLDAALRPMLIMSAAFVPWMSEYLDPMKIPAADVVTKHLSPIVSSTSYDGDGYHSESIGPITQTQAVFAAVGIAAGAGAWRNGIWPPNPRSRPIPGTGTVVPVPTPPTASPSSGGTGLPSQNASGGWTGQAYSSPNSPTPTPEETP